MSRATDDTEVVVFLLALTAVSVGAGLLWSLGAGFAVGGGIVLFLILRR